MRSMRALRGLVCLAWVAGSGCTSLKEIPRGDYAARSERKQVRVFTTDSLEYELDFARIQGDTLIGYRRRDVEGPVEEFDTLLLPLDRVARMSARRLDWYRTGLIGGITLGALVAAGLTARNRNGGGGSDGGEPCRNCGPAR
jgi:hypothetical protein